MPHIHYCRWLAIANSADEVFDLVMTIASSKSNIEEIADHLERLHGSPTEGCHREPLLFACRSRTGVRVLTTTAAVLRDGRGGAGQVDAHADPWGDIEPVRGFGFSDGPQLGSNLILGEDVEAKVLVELAVPGHVGEGRERDGPHVGLTRPPLHSVDERTTDTKSLGRRRDADLLDVSVAVDPIGEDSHAHHYV